MTERGTLTAGLNRNGRRQPGSPTVVIPPLVIALERWVNEGGRGDDPDDTPWLNQAHNPPRPQER